MKRKLLYLVSLLSLVCIQSVKGQKLDEILWPKHSSKLADFVTSQDDIKNTYCFLTDLRLKMVLDAIMRF